MNCESVKSRLSLLLYGELSFHEEEQLEQHLSECLVCSKWMQRERIMHAALDLSHAEAPPALLAQCRRDLLAGLRTQSEVRSADWLGLWQRWFTAGSWLKPVGAAALLAIGFFTARLTSSDPGFGSGFGQAGVTAARVKLVEPGESGQVRITLEETSRRQVMGRVEDQDIRQLLLRAAQDGADPGLRGDSLDLLKGKSEALEVKQALQRALLSDPNPGVRMKALEALRPFAGDNEVRSVLAQVLLKDEHSGLRTQAIDLLVMNKPRDMVSVLQELMQREDNDYIRLRSQRALREMNASVETF
ncbi:MAG: HEAT repeat domain-containing protein [Acidobacteriia bacterium]|nr:HEAT repeat domain-containing protein [Terriglobia bacterium]